MKIAHDMKILEDYAKYFQGRDHDIAREFLLIRSEDRFYLRNPHVPCECRCEGRNWNEIAKLCSI